MTTRQRDAGFTLVEVLVAFATASLGIVVLYSALAGFNRQAASADLRERVLAEAQSQLEAVGHSVLLRPGATTGVYPNGTSWRLTVAAIPDPAPAGAAAAAFGEAGSIQPPVPMLVVLEAFDARGRSILRLKTIKLAAGP